MIDAATLDAGDPCPNCAAPRTGPYCSACGQRAAPLSPTIGHFLREAANDLLNLDGKIVRTVRLLVTRPGALTQEMIAGRRARYVSPLRLYLVFSVLAFALGAVNPDEFDNFDVTFTPSAGEEVTPADLQATEAVTRAVAENLGAGLQRAMFVLVPVFAALVMLVRRQSGLNYPQHLYFALHVHAMWFLVDALNALVGAVGEVPYLSTFVVWATLLWSAVYALLAFRRVYTTTIWGTLWRCAVVGFFYWVALIAALAAIYVPVMLRTLSGAPS